MAEMMAVCNYDNLIQDLDGMHRSYVATGNEDCWHAKVILKAYKALVDLTTSRSIKIGHWKWDFADNGWADHICSECGYRINTDVHVTLDYHYCPHCGAKMEAEHK